MPIFGLIDLQNICQSKLGADLLLEFTYKIRLNRCQALSCSCGGSVVFVDGLVLFLFALKRDVWIWFVLIVKTDLVAIDTEQLRTTVVVLINDLIVVFISRYFVEHTEKNQTKILLFILSARCGAKPAIN